MSPNADAVTLEQRWLLDHARNLLELEPPAGDAACSKAWQRVYLRQMRELRKRSRNRFPDPQAWLWSERSLAQASDWWIATYKASLIPTGSSILDACSGAGADSVAMGRRGRVTAIDVDPLMTALTESNARAHDIQITTHTGPVTAELLRELATESRWLHIDPDRRPADKRTTTADDFSPPLDQVMEFCPWFNGAMIKVAPSTQMEESLERQVEATCRRVWVGNRGECRQQLLLAGDWNQEGMLKRTAVLAEAPTLTHQRATEGSTPWQFTADRSDSDDIDCVLQPGSYVADLHAVLHAADLQREWGKTHHLVPLGGDHGYFTGETYVPDTPWAQFFEVREVLPWDDRQVRRFLRGHDTGVVEVKNRLLRLDANLFQRRYSGAGSQPWTLLVTKLDDRVRAIVAKRI